MHLTAKTIFIWVNYGSAEVYLVDNLAKYETLWARIAECIAELDPTISIDIQNTSIMECINKIGDVGCHELFEHGTGWSVLR